MLCCIAMLSARLRFWLRWRKGSEAVTEIDPAARDRALQTLLVEPQPGIGDPRFALEAGGHRLGIGHAGHPLRVDEGDRLDVVEPGFRQGVDQLDLALGRNRALFELKALARAFLVDLHELGKIGHRFLPSGWRIMAQIPRRGYAPGEPNIRPA